MKPATFTLRVLAHLLSYPDASLRDHLAEMAQALQHERALDEARLAPVLGLIQHLQRTPALRAEADYVELFDRGRGTALHLFEHVHGDSRDRGPAMIDLTHLYQQAGLYLADGELPDHLTVVLEFASTQPPQVAQDFLGELAHILQALLSALLKRQSPYAGVVAAVLALAGESPQPVPVPDEPALDEAWQEPEAFGGCSSAGQVRPGQPQPIHIMARPGQTGGDAPAHGARS